MRSACPSAALPVPSEQWERGPTMGPIRAWPASCELDPGMLKSAPLPPMCTLHLHFWSRLLGASLSQDLGRLGLCGEGHSWGIVAGQGPFSWLRCRRLGVWGRHRNQPSLLVSEANDGSEPERADGESGANVSIRAFKSPDELPVVYDLKGVSNDGNSSLPFTVAQTTPGLVRLTPH